MEPSLFIPEDGGFRATPLTTGPWDRRAQHGGAPAALLMRAFEGLPAAAGLQIARVTIEFMRPVPVDLLTLEAEVIRGGKRVQLLEARIRDAQGTEVVRARAVQVAAASVRHTDAAAGVSPGLGALETEQVLPGPDSGRAEDTVPPGPESGRADDMVPPFRPMFAPDGVELRFTEGAFTELGPATAWFRLRFPVVPAEDPTPLQRLAAAGDFGNGISCPLSWLDHVFINPDLTLYVERPPSGEWIALRSRTRVNVGGAGIGGGVGIAESELFDQHGRVGRAIQSLLVAPR